MSSRKLVILVLAAGAAMLFTRRPDALLNPQFWAEDGAVWYPQAYESGVRSLTFPQVGYLQTAPRIAAVLVQPLPLLWAPAIFNAIALVIQLLPAAFLVSRRFSRFRLSGRLLLAFLYLAAPNCGEVHVNITSSQWHLALLACLVVLAEPAASLGWRAFDLAVLLISGLSGPFAIPLAPIALALWWLKRDRARLLAAGVLSLGAAVQLAVLLATIGERTHAPRGASLALLVHILGRHVFWGAVEGASHPFTTLVGHHLLLFSAAALAGVATLAYALWRGPLELRAFILFSWIVLAASLMHPQVSVADPQWPVLANAAATRYWLFPMLAFFAALVWLLGDRMRLIRTAAALALIASAAGVALDWRWPARVDYRFPERARAFEAAAPGATVVIPINPPGWRMRLVKR